jgi:hypothetical protein
MTMAKRRDRMLRSVSREHDNLMLMTTFRGGVPCVTAATDSMVEVADGESPAWVYLPLDSVIRSIVAEHDDHTITELRKIVSKAVREGFAQGVADRKRNGGKAKVCASL